MRSERKKLIVYLASGLFNSAERLRNAQLAFYLRKLGRKVILPQKEALKFYRGGLFETKAMAIDCAEKAGKGSHICVALADGAETDAGMGIEFGIAYRATERAILVRTDFRTHRETEVGLNAMFEQPGVSIIIAPCFDITTREISLFHKKLARKIEKEICGIEKREGH